MKILLLNQQKHIKINSPLMRAIAGFVAANELNIYSIKHSPEAKTGDTEFLIYFTNEVQIKKLHDRIFKKNTPTDVISFEYLNNFSHGDRTIGEVFVSVDEAEKKHKLYKTSFEQELILYMIHGILHVFGYDDLDPGSRRLMRNREAFYMNFIFRGVLKNFLKG